MCRMERISKGLMNSRLTSNFTREAVGEEREELNQNRHISEGLGEWCGLRLRDLNRVCAHHVNQT